MHPIIIHRALFSFAAHSSSHSLLAIGWTTTQNGRKTAPSVYKHVTSFYFHWLRSETSIPSVSADWARSLGALGNAVAAVAVVCHLFKFYVVYCIASAVWIISFVLMVLHFFSTSLLANLSMFYFAFLPIAVFSIVMYVMLTYRLFYLDENVCLYVSSG